MPLYSELHAIKHYEAKGAANTVSGQGLDACLANLVAGRYIGQYGRLFQGPTRSIQNAYRGLIRGMCLI
jgi:hypothetical protein